MNDHRRAGAHSEKWTRSEARKARKKETRFEGCGLRERNEEDVEGGRKNVDMKHSKKNGLQQETRPVGAYFFIKCYPSSRS